jgi:hypothetical protein
MQIPAVIYGTFADAKPRCAAAVRSFLKGQSWDDALSAASFVDSESNSSLFVMNGPAPLLGGEPHFHLFLPLALLLEQANKGKADPPRLEEAVTASLNSPWGTLGVLAPKNQMLVYAPHRHRPILNAASVWWPQLDAAARYSVGMQDGKRLWETVTNLQYLLGQVGVPIEVIRAPLPSHGLQAILPDSITHAPWKIGN